MKVSFSALPLTSSFSSEYRGKFVVSDYILSYFIQSVILIVYFFRRNLYTIFLSEGDSSRCVVDIKRTQATVL